MITRIDHVAITVEDLDRSLDFYGRVLNAALEVSHVIDGAVAVLQLRIGQTLVNVHRQGHSHPLIASQPRPGAADLCFAWEGSIEAASRMVSDGGATIIEGPVERTGSQGNGISIYFRDPDGNLLELLAT